ncbi:ATP-dependent Clp protease ATP-binding subunit ClpC [Urinicoccus massiliensis]|uniref:ATP-dependent Clp protease ATP-binding subunit ClpC n=1 Tax=Urinicoccus massiliensis TaxID=1723382 RepID=A0A8H2QXF3_9FIRM|nr:ATP-dependent Clp protease ATP-binding subunit [Urinicoccus massiliensis]VFB15749.1 ATP-dependent Clp protease ATP-binding subunit ClpC [Urinicoccus massiliensis]
MGMYGRFTEKSQAMIIQAQEEAKSQGHNYVGSEHLILSMLKDPSQGAGAFLAQAGLDYESFKKVSMDLVPPEMTPVQTANYTPRTKRIFEISFEIARSLGQGYVSTEHILLAILSEGKGVGVLAMRNMGIDPNQLEKSIYQSIQTMMGQGQAPQGDKQEGEESYLEKFASNLVEVAKKGKIDPVIGREEEIQRIIQVLSRRRKNNPVLIGEPGVGKTAIVEGLAQKMATGNVPEIIKGQKIYSVDLSAMLAGARYRGDFEERLKGLLEEVQEEKNAILFIDELHVVMGAGASEGAMDASNILKPVLTRGDLQMIGATTIDEYRRYIEQDTAFERRLMPIYVDEPAEEDSITIIQGLRDKYEAHHGVKITDQAIEAAVELTHRYINDRFLPDKAIDVIDEAASKLRVHSMVSPSSIQDLEKKLEKYKNEKQAAVDAQDFEAAAKLRDQEKTTKAQLDQEKALWDKESKQSKMVVDQEEIAEIVADWSGVPITKISREQSKELLDLEANINKVVKGQEDAVKAIAKSVKRARVGLKDPEKPIGSFLFVGPTGVGKTFLAKQLAKELFGSQDAMLRFDMSEYMEKHTVSRLVGSPPGYVGYDEGGQLTEQVRTKPYSVLLFDEIEKAHPDVFNILLQVLDDGRLTDGQGRTIDFKNTLVIMTSNAGSAYLKKQNTLGFGLGQEDQEDREKIKSTIQEELKKLFRPEFLNRIDEVIVFNKLGQKEVQSIVERLLEDLQDRLEDVGTQINFDPNLAPFIAQKGYDPQYGARPLERSLRKLVEEPLTDKILEGNQDQGRTFHISVQGQEIQIQEDQEEKDEESQEPVQV